MQAEWRRLMRAAEATAQLDQLAAANGGEGTARPSWWKRVIGR